MVRCPREHHRGVRGLCWDKDNIPWLQREQHRPPHFCHSTRRPQVSTSSGGHLINDLPRPPGPHMTWSLPLSKLICSSSSSLINLRPSRPPFDSSASQAFSLLGIFAGALPSTWNIFLRFLCVWHLWPFSVQHKCCFLLHVTWACHSCPFTPDHITLFCFLLCTHYCAIILFIHVFVSSVSLSL